MPAPLVTYSKTHAFFSSSSVSPVPPPNLPASKSSQSFKSEPSRSRSFNVGVFGVTSQDARPPTPSLISRNSSATTSSSGSNSPVSSSTSDASPLSIPSVQLLSRLFPSRYNPVDDSSLQTSRRRPIFEIDETETPQRRLIDDVLKTEDTPKSINATLNSTFMVPGRSTPRPIPTKAQVLDPTSNYLTMSPSDDTFLASDPRANTASSVSIDLLPTPFGSRCGSTYEPSGTPRQDSGSLEQQRSSESADVPLQPGSVISSNTPEGNHASLTLIRVLGQGSFSSVWLSRDDSRSLVTVIKTRRASIKRQQRNGEGVVRRKSSRRLGRRMEGTKPWHNAISLDTKNSPGTHDFDLNGQNGADESAVDGSRLFAVKMTERALYDANDRTRVSFIREVEVLKHISHPSIVSYIHSFVTPTHHCLVLEYIKGEELFELINSDEKYAQMNEPLLQRMWFELCKAVGWLHEVALVHRDIKLENILLTRDLRLPQSSAPLIKLTDFGLSRFVDPDNSLLTTRCGSESYAAPEIITGRKYDGRETDAWACGVVLYALATRKLPFDSGSTGLGRKEMLMRIAKSEYEWPKDEPTGLWNSEGLKRIVGRLLVRDPRKRSKIRGLWSDEWMLREEALIPPLLCTPSLPPEQEEVTENDVTEDELIDDGLIVDGDLISSVASQELQ